MWPQALQMTRDECRGILRRLELESYSQVISVFRAQGGLSDAKAKLLEELRGIFHISNERHRAEARRVANDEQLATIAEAISGPNTWQEWSREGRRPYPMLPRVAPQTALALIANNVSEETAQENAKLPYPADTAEAIKEEQLQIENQKSMEAVVDRSNNYVVTDDPFKIPQIPTNTKKNLKRNTSNDQYNSGGGGGKKRNLNDNSPQKMPSNYKQYPHITANSPQTANTASSSPSNIAERKQKQRDAAAEQHLLKQRFFYQQHQMTKQKMAKKAAAAAAAANNATMGQGKRQATPAKSGRRANQKMLIEQQKQMAMKQLQMDMNQQQQQQSIPMQIDLSGNAATTSAQALLTQQQLDMQFVTYAQSHQPPQQIFMEKDILETVQTLTPLTTVATAGTTLNQHLPTSLITPLSTSSSSSPQIAASKRDISKNLNKLQMQQQTQLINQSISNISSTLPPANPITSHDLSNILPSSSAKSLEKSLISTTPVQKYIVEERQPGIGPPGTVVNLQNPTGGVGSTATTTHIIQVSSSSGQQPQIMTLPQFSAAATKLRAVNTTLIAPGAKLTATSTKKLSASNAAAVGGVAHSPINAGALHELANIASTQSQVLHIVESAQGNAGGGGSQNNVTTHLTPLHTPPAVIQIHNASAVNTATSPDIFSSSSSQSKVLTTKILPLVLTGTAGNQNTANATLINNSSLVVASSPTTSISITSTTSTGQHQSTTYIKNLPSTMLLNTSTANLTPVTVTSTNNTIISTLGAGATMFRKPPNIIKTSQAITTPTKSSSISSSSSSAPHIISNVKLTPVSVSSTNSGTHLTTTNTFKNVIPSTSGMVRTSVKICQSPNGKVFIQPAGLVDATKMKLNTSAMTHKIISTNASSVNSSSNAGGGQRIAIQKVQIIPAPVGSPVGSVVGGSGNHHHHHLNTKSATMGKSNMIFMPTSATNVRPVTLSKMGNNILLKSSCNQNLTTSSTTTMADNSNVKPNIVVLGPPPPTASSSSSSSQTLKDQISTPALKLESNQLINEDTPLDILNMPIVMESGIGVSSSSAIGDTVTLLQSNIIETTSAGGPNAAATTTSLILETTPLPATQTVILGATDWEMELDQAITTAANTQNVMAAAAAQKSNHKQKRTISSSSSTSSTSGNITTSSSVQLHKHKRLNSDLVSIELKTKESNSSPINTTSNTTTTTTTTTTNYTTSSNSSQNVIVVDDSFDDVIVEEHDDDMGSTTASNSSGNSKQQQQQLDDSTPKILDMQIYQQHDGHDNKIKAQIPSANDANTELIQSQEKQQVSTMPSSTSEQDQQQQQQQEPQQHDCEIDAGFDETIVTEIDENTAIEYIEEDGGSEAPNMSTTTTTTMITNKNNKPLTTAAATTASATAVTTIANKDDAKTSKAVNVINNHLASSTTTAELTTTTATTTAITTTTTADTNEITTTETTTTATANNSATQQVEP